MESSGKAITPGTVKNDESTLTPTPDVKKSSWFTPCKRLGLKRKSQSISTPSSASLSSSTPSTPNSSFKSHRQSFVTPVRKNESFGAKTVEGPVGLGPSVPTRLCLVQDETSPALRDGRVETSNAAIKTSIPSPHKENTPIRYMPRTPRQPNNLTTPVRPGQRPMPFVTETETLHLEEPTEENLEILRKRVKEKEERVSALQLARLYKKKHDTEKLSELTKKWRNGCQDALLQLHEKTKSLAYELTMPGLLAQLGIPQDLVQYDPDLEDFKE